MNIYANDKSKIVSPSQSLIEIILLGASFFLIAAPFIGAVV